MLLNTCIDSLYLRCGAIGAASSWFANHAETWRAHKATADYGTPELLVELPGLGTFKVLFRGDRPYEFILSNPEIADIRLWNPQKWNSKAACTTGQVYIVFRSRWMQLNGLGRVREFANQLMDLCFSGSAGRWTKVSRADLAADIARDEFFTWNDLERFVSRARIRDDMAAAVDDLADVREQLKQGLTPRDNKGGATYMDSQDPCNAVVLSRDQADRLRGVLDDLANSTGPDATLTRAVHRGALQTLYFGRFGGALYCRVYDKTAEIKKSGKTYLEDTWKAAGWSGDGAVARVEFSLSGEFLKAAGGINGSGLPDIDLRPLEAFQNAVPALWQYLTGDWLRLTVPNGDTNRWRWDLDPFWETVKGAWPDAVPIVRCKPPRRPIVDQLMAQIKGCILTATALRSRRDSDGNRTGLQVITELLDAVDGDRFESEVDTRRKELGIDDFSDTWFSSSARSQSMLDGYGS
jgi:hypothetical protein